VIRKYPMMLLGMVLAGQMPAVGQVRAPQIVLEQKWVLPPITAFRAEFATLSALSFLPSQDRENSLAHSSLSGTYTNGDRLESLSPIVKVNTLILTRSSLPLVQLWDGKLQLEAFQSTLRIQNVQIGPMGYGGTPNFRLPQQNVPGGSRSVHFSGLSLNFHFGRVERARRPTQSWKCVPRIVAALLN
jgi:hypothetical protein